MHFLSQARNSSHHVGLCPVHLAYLPFLLLIAYLVLCLPTYLTPTPAHLLQAASHSCLSLRNCLTPGPIGRFSNQCGRVSYIKLHFLNEGLTGNVLFDHL